MSGHRRVKDISYDDDELDEYSGEYYGDEGEQELSSEDQEQMRQGTTKVREALGPNYAVSDKEIQDALWHYYYDVPKSVVYLKNLRPPAQPKKPKQESRFDKAASAASAAVKTQSRKEPDSPTSTFPLPMLVTAHDPPFRTADVFEDTPWLGVPSHRHSNILIEPIYPRGGLLGGSSKPSKLAALAAARKKKAEEDKRIHSQPVPSSDQDLKQSERTVSLLDRLKAKGKESEPSGSAAVDSTSGGVVLQPQDRNRAYPIRSKKDPSPERAPKEDVPAVSEVPEKEASAKLVQDLRAVPSIFASTLVGARPRELYKSRPANGVQSSVTSPTLPQEDSMFALPFADRLIHTKSNPFAGPSPDDVVLSAQAKGSKTGKSPAKQASGGKSVNGITEGVASLTAAEAPRIKSKNLNVAEEFKKPKRKNAASFVVIGHVDHGKSTLMGRLLYDLKVVDQRSVDKLRREAENIGKSSFALAWVMDQTSEERERGVTVDIATSYFETEKTRFTILDAPGHQDFIPNMIAGASQADFAVLVIDASTNSFESGLRGQTKEHALLVRSMGVQRLVVAVNKMDTVSWSQDRFREIEQQMSAFLTAAGFQAKNLVFVPCAGLTGDNIVRPLSADIASWYNGRTLIEELDASVSDTDKRALEKPLRLSIADIFRGSVTNPLSVSGRLDAGSVQVGDAVVAMPSGERGAVKAIEVDNEAADWAVAGQIAVLHLADIDPEHLRLGDILCDPARPIKNVTSFTAKILAFEHVLPGFVDVHRGRLHAPARIAKLVAVLDKSSGEAVKKKPRVVQPGSVARVVVEMESALPLEAPGRVVLRAEGQTLAAGLLEAAN